MKKIILILSAVLIVIIILIIIILNSLKTKSAAPTPTSVIPTTYPFSSSNRFISSAPSSPSITAAAESFNTSSLSTEEKNSLALLKKVNKYESSDFDITYDKNQDKFIIDEKTDQAEEILNLWLKKNNLEFLRNNSDLTIVKNPLQSVASTGGENQVYMEFLQQNNLESYIPSSSNNSSGNSSFPITENETSTTTTSNDLSLLTDLLKILLNTNISTGISNKDISPYIEPELTNSPAPTTTNPVPDNSPLPSNIAPGNIDNELVSGLVGQIRSNCSNNQVTVWNNKCLNNVAPSIDPEAAKLIMQYSSQRFQYLQCVGFVQGMVLSTTKSILTKGGNAKDFATNIPDGYRFIQNASRSNNNSPQPGDLTVWSSGTYGHIAYVVKTYDQNNIRVAEANYGVSGRVQERNVNLNYGNIAGWLTENE